MAKFSTNPRPRPANMPIFRDSQRNFWFTTSKRNKLRAQKAEALAEVEPQALTFGLIASIFPNPAISEALLATIPAPRVGTAGGALPGEETFPMGGSGTSGDSQGLVATLNTATGNTLFSLPITGWSGVGDTSVSFSLFRNTLEKDLSPEFDTAWSHSYNSRVDISGTDAFLTMPDGLVVPYTVSGGSFTRPNGWFSDLSNKPGGGYILKFKDQTTFEYNSDGWLIAHKDRLGNATTITRVNDRITEVKTPDNRKLEFSYTSSGVNITGPDSRVWSIDYNSNGSSITYPTVTVAGTPQSYTRAIDFGGGGIASETDLRGNIWTWTYNLAGFPSVTDPGLNLTNSGVTSTGVVTITLPEGQQYLHYYGPIGLWQSLDPEGFGEYIEDRNINRLPLAVEQYGPDTITAYEWDSMGNMTEFSDELGKVTKFTYNTATNDLLKVERPGLIGRSAKHETTNVYYPNGLLHKVIGADSVTQSEFTYNTAGDMLTAKDAMGIITAFNPNARGEVLSTTDAAGVVTNITYNNYSRPITVVTGGTGTTTITYDQWGRQTEVLSPGSVNPSRTEYDAGGNVVKSWNEIGKLSEWTYGPEGYLTQFKNPRGDIESYQYSPNGWMTKLTNGKGENTLYEYTGRGERSKQTLADGAVTDYQYDGVGRLTQKRKPDLNIIKYEYSARGENTKIDYPTGVDTTFAYDDWGRQTSMVDSTGTTNWAYDDYDRVTSISQPHAGGYSTSYVYNAAGQRERMTEGSNVTQYQYDYSTPRLSSDTGRLLKMINPLGEETQYEYDGEGRLFRQRYHNGTREVFAYDDRDRVTQVNLTRSTGQLIRGLTYAFDDASQVTGLTTSIPQPGGVPSDTVTYGYDDAGQLISEARPGTIIGYTYDSNGNRTSKTLNGVTDSYAYGLADKLTSITRAGSLWRSYAYDANGNTTSINENGSVRNFAYDIENRVTSISGAYTASYSYNGAGTRVAKTEGGVPNAFKRDGVGVTAPVLSDGAATYTPGVSERRGSVTKYLHSGIKSADVQTNASQTIDSSRKYDAFGAVLSSNGTWSGPFGNAGKFGYQEDASGYQLLGHRYYDPSTGRFLTRDPIQDGRNWYTYCENTPISAADSTGLFPHVIVLAIVAGLILATEFIISYVPVHQEGQKLGNSRRQDLISGLENVFDVDSSGIGEPKPGASKYPGGSRPPTLGDPLGTGQGIDPWDMYKLAGWTLETTVDMYGNILAVIRNPFQESIAKQMEDFVKGLAKDAIQNQWTDTAFESAETIYGGGINFN